MLGLPEFNKILERVFSKNKSRLTRENVMVWGVLLAGVLAVLVILWDAVVFVASVAAERERAEVRAGVQPLRAGEIDEVIKLLDGRKEKFDELLAE